MKVINSMFKTVSMITLFSVITRFLGFIFRIFISRKLGAEGLGIYQIASSIIGVFMTLVASGLPLTTAKQVANYDNQKNHKKKHIVTTSATIIALIISIASCVVLLLTHFLFDIFVKNTVVIELILIMCPALIFSAIYAIFRGSLWGQNSYFWVSFTEFFEQVARMVLTFFVLYKVTSMILSVKLVALTFTISCFLSMIFVIIIYFIKGGKLIFKKGEYKKLIKSSSPITAIRIASSFVQPLTAILIPFLLTLIGFSESKAISTYGLIMGMTFPLLLAPLSIVGSLSMVLIPKISVLYSNKDYQTISNNVTKSINFSLFLSSLLIPLYLSCGDLIGVVLYDNVQSGIYLQLSAVIILPLVLNNITSSVLNALNLEVKSFKNYIIGTIVMFICLISLTFVIKENSIIISEFISSVVIAFLNMKMIKKAIPNFKLDLATLLLKYSIIMLPTSLLGHLISNILYHYLPALFAGLVGGGVAIISTLLLVKTFNLYAVNLKKFKLS